MDNLNSFAAVGDNRYTDQFICPLYDSYCFSRLPGTVSHLLTGQQLPSLPGDVLPGNDAGYDTVILFFIDALGWRFLEPIFDRYPFLQHFKRSGVVSKLTSQFPSTTAAHVTTIHTGLSPAQSGIYEWFQYEPYLHRIIAPLMFNYAGEQARDTLPSSGLQPASLFPRRTIYEDLGARGVQPSIMQSSLYAYSLPSKHFAAGAQIIAYKTWSEALVLLQRLLERQTAPAYYLLYYGDIDTICHNYGPDSREVTAEIDTFMVTMERLLLQTLAGKCSRTLLLLTADHGQTAINPDTTIYLNRHEKLRELRRYMQLDQEGNPLAPAGSTRDIFLHIKPEFLSVAVSLLKSAIGEKALIAQTTELVNQGFFGPRGVPPSDHFLNRVGNVVVLPYTGESVYWYERGKFEQHFYGHHGGLSRDEMEIPLLACNL